MTRQELYQWIELPPEIAAKLEAVRPDVDWDRAAPYLEGLLDAETARSAYQQLRDLLSEDEGHFQLLCCYLECARRAFERYQQRSIPNAIYADTMKCFPRFLAECEKEQGRMYFNRGWWAYRQTSMQLFRIGALEYEFLSHEGKPALALHIPTDADLSGASVDRSLAQAEEFFSTYYPEYRYKYYTCNSWLLSPRIRPLLAGSSNILAFQNRFRLLRETPEDREFIQWLFQCPADTGCDRLPESTSLQRGVKALLLDGGSVGCAYGVMERKI